MALVMNSSDFMSEFFFYLHSTTGYRKESFSSKGLKIYLKDAAIKFYQLNLTGKTLELVFKIIAFFTGKLVTTKENIEKAIVTFVFILQKLASFLINLWAGQTLALVLEGASAPVEVFLIGLYYTAMFVYEYFANKCFLQLKEWLILLMDTKTMHNFFDVVFPNYGKTITYVNGNSAVTITELN